MTFLDETDEVASTYDGDSDAIIPRFEDQANDQSVLSDSASQGESPVHSTNQSSGTGSSALSTSSSHLKSSMDLVNFPQRPDPLSLNPSMPSYHHPLTIEELIDQRATGSAHQHGHQMYGHDHNASTIPQIYSRTPIWPLTDPSEALLLRHFVQNLAIWVRRASSLPIIHT